MHLNVSVKGIPCLQWGSGEVGSTLGQLRECNMFAFSVMLLRLTSFASTSYQNMHGTEWRDPMGWTIQITQYQLLRVPIPKKFGSPADILMCE